MDEHGFEEALDRSGTNPSCRRLYELMKGLRADSLGVARPTIAERYLRSFTDDSFPDRTRRWVRFLPLLSLEFQTNRRRSNLVVMTD